MIEQEENNNPPAFPSTEVFGETTYYKFGMTLRDYFAAKAMTKLIEDTPANPWQAFRRWLGYDYTSKFRDVRGVAEEAYDIAAAMLVNREYVHEELTKNKE